MQLKCQKTIGSGFSLIVLPCLECSEAGTILSYIYSNDSMALVGGVGLGIFPQ